MELTEETKRAFLQLVVEKATTACWSWAGDHMQTFGHCFAAKKLIALCTNYGLAMFLPISMSITNARTLPALILGTLSRFRQRHTGHCMQPSIKR